MIRMTNKELSPSEAIIDTIAVSSSSCYGCEKTGTDFMLSAVVIADPRRNGNATFYDLFLSRAQVEALFLDMKAALDRKPT